jgi:hypothetical protein
MDVNMCESERATSAVLPDVFDGAGAGICPLAYTSAGGNEQVVSLDGC